MGDIHKNYQIPDKIAPDNNGDIEVGRIITWTDPRDPSNLVPANPNHPNDKKYPNDQNGKGHTGDMTSDNTDEKYTNNYGESGVVLGDKINHNAEKYRPINFDNLVPIQITTTQQQKMFKNLCIPSAMHAYSVGVEFFKQWVLNKFDPKYFKTVYVDGKHLFDDFSKINELDLVKKGKPAIGFFPNIDIDYNREGIEAQTYDLMY